ELVEGGRAVVGHGHLVPLPPQQVGERIAEGLFVLHDEDPGHARAPLGSGRDAVSTASSPARTSGGRSGRSGTPSRSVRPACWSEPGPSAGGGVDSGSRRVNVEP